MNSNYALGSPAERGFIRSRPETSFSTAPPILEEPGIAEPTIAPPRVSAPIRARPAAPPPEVVPGEPADPVPSEREPGRYPHIPRFAEVPDGAKWPHGPYQQAPEEFGGEWWLVNPFTGLEPWKVVDYEPRPSGGELSPEDKLKLSDFKRVFGERPGRGVPPPEGQSMWTAQHQWDYNFHYFEGIREPTDFPAEKIQAAMELFDEYGLGRPVFYEGRYGVMGRFVDSELPTFEYRPSGAFLTPQLVVGSYQLRLMNEGITPERLHPMLT